MRGEMFEDFISPVLAAVLTGALVLPKCAALDGYRKYLVAFFGAGLLYAILAYAIGTALLPSGSLGTDILLLTYVAASPIVGLSACLLSRKLTFDLRGRFIAGARLAGAVTLVCGIIFLCFLLLETSSRASTRKSALTEEEERQAKNSRLYEDVDSNKNVTLPLEEGVVAVPSPDAETQR
jgi:hypothetical protein